MKKAYVNGKIYIERGRFAEALLTEDGIITAVGANGEIRAMAGAEAEITDCGGRTMLPGLNDSHMHFNYLSESMYNVQLGDCRTHAEIIERCRAFIAEHPDRVKNGLYGRGWNQEYFTDDTRIPDRYELDRISTKVPIVLKRVCGHILVVNTKALERMGITMDSHLVESGDVESENGELTGRMYENGFDSMPYINPIFSTELKRDLLYDTMGYAASLGLTSVQSNDITADGSNAAELMELYSGLYDEGRGYIRYRHQITTSNPAEVAALAAQKRFAQGRDAMLTVGPLKIILDGSLGARTAALKLDYCDDPGNCGFTWYTQEELDAMCAAAAEGGVQIVVHAIGDRAIEMIVNSFEKVIPPEGNVLRHAIIHCHVTDRALVERIARLGIHIMFQPVLLSFDMHMMDERVGHELSATSNAYGTFSRIGGSMSFGTDCPVEDCAPFPNIHCAVNRRDLSVWPEGGYFPEECVDIYTAIDAYTEGSAYAEFAEGFKGRIKAGYVADLVLLDRDIFTIDPLDIINVKPVLTIVGGKTVYKGE